MDSEKKEIGKTRSAARNTETQDTGRVRLGDGAVPSFRTSSILSKDAATQDSGRVRLGEGAAPSFGNTKPRNDSATRDNGKVRLGDGNAPFFGGSTKQ